MQAIDLEHLKEHGIEKKIFGHDFVYRYPESKDMPLLNPQELALDLGRRKHKELAFYFHIPFCSKHCNFCHYYKETPSPPQIEKYIFAMKRELAAYGHLLGKKVKVQSVFFGGGTPTMLSAEQLAGLLESVKGLFPVGKRTEISIESSPETLGKEKLLSLRKAGFNRLSIGCQDFNEAVLEKSNRAHSPKQAERAFKEARAAGFENINIDLIYGLPGQSTGQWEKTVEKAKQLGSDSVAASDLRVRKNTAFFAWKRELFPSIAEMREMYYCFVETFLKQGYLQQFPYQFVRKGKEMLFLENQWSCGEFVGFGASSCSFAGSWDYNNAMPLHNYFHAVEENGIGAATGKRLSNEEQMKRFVALGLKRSGANRKDRGVSKKEFSKKFGVSLEEAFGSVIGELKEIGLVKEKNGFLGLSNNGLFFHDEIARKFF